MNCSLGGAGRNKKFVKQCGDLANLSLVEGMRTLFTILFALTLVQGLPAQEATEMETVVVRGKANVDFWCHPFSTLEVGIIS